MLEPQDRRLFLQSLRPPDGYVLDRALGTTYCLDLLALLTAPLAFTMFDWEDEEGRAVADPLALLEALRRNADRTAVFCQAGEIKLPPRDQLLLGYLESSIVEATAAHSGGVFHPKVWALRFAAPDGPVLYRLICLSRNLTFDQSWDTILVAEGELVERQKAFAANHPLADFVKALPGLAIRKVSDRVQAIVDQFHDELRRVRFETPEGFDDLIFHPSGHDGRTRLPFDRVDRALVISPFLSDGFLEDLAADGKRHVLVSRLDSLQALQPTTRSLFKSLHVLREGTEGETDGEGTAGTNSLSGLHAKVYIVDDGWNASVYCGSANATNAGFGRNVEFLVELRGKKSKYGVEATLAPSDRGVTLSSLLDEVKIAETIPVDSVREELDSLLREARCAIWEAGLRLEVQLAGDDVYRVLLGQAKPIRLPQGATARCWPITLREEAARELGPETGVAFGPLTFEALSSFLAFEVVVSVKEQTEACRFVLNLPLIGAPADRKERLLRSLLRDRDQVLRLLLLLLSEGGIDASGLLKPNPPGNGKAAHGVFGQTYLFESLMKALARSPQKLNDVESLFTDLCRSEQTRCLLPEGFEAVWAPVWAAHQALVAKATK